MQDVSPDGLRCVIPQYVPVGCTLWLQFEPDVLTSCEQIERKAVVLQHGILGKVIWVNELPENRFDVGIQFVTREVCAHNKKESG